MWLHFNQNNFAVEKINQANNEYNINTIFMKKTLTLLAIAVTLMTVSCSNDDSPANLTKEVTGTYSGYTSASCAYFSGSMSADQKVVISEGSSANKVNVN